MTYIVVGHEDAEELEREVNKKIIEGYKPQGGVSIAVYTAGGPFYTYLFQAMVKS
jgi:hypothetical protein